MFAAITQQLNLLDLKHYDLYQRKQPKFLAAPPQRIKRSKIKSRSVKTADDDNYDKENQLKKESFDYDGLSNVIRKTKFPKPRRWKPKFPDATKAVSSSDLPTETDDATEIVDTNALRKCRASRFTRFKYPEKFHNVDVQQNAVLEEHIPVRLRHHSRYIRLPVKQNCADSNGSVTYILNHKLLSTNLPHPSVSDRNRFHMKEQRPKPAGRHSRDKIKSKTDNTESIDNYDLQDESENRNGSYHFVYNDSRSSSSNQVASHDQSCDASVLDLQDSFKEESPRYESRWDDKLTDADEIAAEDEIRSLLDQPDDSVINESPVDEIEEEQFCSDKFDNESMNLKYSVRSDLSECSERSLSLEAVSDIKGPGSAETISFKSDVESVRTEKEDAEEIRDEVVKTNAAGFRAETFDETDDDDDIEYEPEFS